VGKSPSIIKAAIRRFDSLMAIGDSRFAAKQAARETAQAAGHSAPWTVSDNRIHSHSARKAYQRHALRFVNWARVQGVRKLDQLDARREELVTCYLIEQRDAGRSAYSLAAYRAALRTFFGDRSLADQVDLPRRSRANIRRSRGVAVRDHEFSEARHEVLITFLRATGLRRSEVRDIRINEIRETGDGLEVHVRNGKGGRARDVPVRPRYADQVRQLIANRDPILHVFTRIPSHLDVHALRREFAQGMYQELSGRALPPAAGRLPKNSYDAFTARAVSQALGHNRIDVVLNHYLR
jgi:integrase